MASGPTITAKFLADTSQMTSGIDKATSDAGGKMSSFAKTAATVVGGAFVADKVLDFGKASVEAAAADAEAQAQLAAALKNTTGATTAQVAAAEDFVSNLSKSAAIADDDLRPALATLARGFGDTGKAQDALTLATDVAAGTGKDLATVTAAMSKGALGSTGALGKLGVATKDAAGHALSMDQIMANLATTFKGQASTAAHSTAGEMRSAQIAMGEMRETIGSALLPVIGKLATFLNNTLFPALSTAFGWLMDHKTVLVAALIGIGAVVLPLFVSWAIAAGAAAIATIAAAAPFILIGAAIAAVAYMIITNWDTIVAATKAAWDFVLGIVQGVWNWISENWPLLLAIITGPIGLAVDFIVSHWDSITGGAQAVLDWFANTWSTIYDHIAGPVSSAIDFIRGLFDDVVSVVSGIVSAIVGPINGVIRAWNALAFTIPSFTLPSFDLGPVHLGGQTFGGARIDFPDLPQLAAGGMITSTGLVYAHAGEVISPIDKVPGFGGPTVHIDYAQFNDPVDVELLAKHLEFALSSGMSL
jgi:hypothetical protein